MNLLRRNAALCLALPVLAIGCKKPSEAPAPGSTVVSRALGPKPRPGIPAKYDPARKMAGRAPRRTKAPLARLRMSAPSRSTPTRVGQGSLGFSLAGKAEHFRVQVYEHRGRYHLAGERPGLGATLVLSSLEPGSYSRSAVSRWPSLKLSLGSGRARRSLVSTTETTGREMPALKLLIRRSGEALTGTFSGQLRGSSGKVNLLTAGTFSVRLEIPAVRHRRRVRTRFSP